MRSLVLVAAVVLLALLAYKAVETEDGLNNADAFWWDYARRKGTRFVSIVGDHLGLGHPVRISREITARLAPSKILNWPEGGVKLEATEFGGVPVRVYTPHDADINGPAFIWIHGGGWVSYDAASDDFLCAEIAKKIKSIVVSIDYRLAPEHPYPAAIDDCFSATVHFLENAEDYKVNPDRVAVGGASAGGNLAAAVSLKMRDTNQKHRPKLQILVVPCLQAYNFLTPSYVDNEYNAFLPKSWMINYWLWYATGERGHDNRPVCYENNHVPSEATKYSSYIHNNLVPEKYRFSKTYPDTVAKSSDSALWSRLQSTILDPYFAPLMASDLTNLPEAYVIVSQFDVLRDDGVMYAHRLEAAGVPVRVDYQKGAAHPTVHLYERFPEGRKCLDDLLEYVLHNL